jgi:ketosteroid isomerase-like protein
MKLGSLGANEREILSARKAQNQAIAAYNADSVAAFWTEDVELRRGLGQLVLGRAAYRQLFLGDAANRDSALVYQREPSHIESSPTWPLAFESGTWEAHVGRVDGPVVIRGQYGAQWVKRAGRWLIRGGNSLRSCARSVHNRRAPKPIVIAAIVIPSGRRSSRHNHSAQILACSG